MKKFLLFSLVVILIGVFSAGFGMSLFSSPNNWYQMSFQYEAGALSVLFNDIQYGHNTTNFDYVSDGGESILFPVDRYSVDFTFLKNNELIFLYQPLDIQTEGVITEPITISYQTFPASSVMLYNYGFSFWRISYLYDLINTSRAKLGIGLSLQLRNASIIFQSLDGEYAVVSENLGPVPILKLKGQYNFDNGMYVATDIDGFYASSKFFNGSNFDFTGSILDASLSLGFRNTDYLDTFANVRFLGGSAVGISQYPTVPQTDGYTSNYLGTMTFTLGFNVH
ncbi:MAG: hypothetical protein C0176_04195 [Mesoaciditoga sp.]|uniref:hypothetical protein n=1 Tax=Athalassotoga sp. TaxID=2022597 RepID=UPI000CABBEFF|nr:MAG: hypothetical protein C0176_04195 [Mesoaciditoga sp.]HEU24697.1 hypothetical protein [Mesoaciditoga lauensis]